jgi:hypothetical protein
MMMWCYCTPTFVHIELSNRPQLWISPICLNSFSKSSTFSINHPLTFSSIFSLNKIYTIQFSIKTLFYE